MDSGVGESELPRPFRRPQPRVIQKKETALTIQLSKGYSAIIDDADFVLIQGISWHAIVKRYADGTIRTVYAATGIRINGKCTTVLMHRFLLGVTDPAIDVDHHDRNGLNNRRLNLRKCGRTSNLGNQAKRRGSSIYKGVSRATSRGKWKAQISINKRDKNLGYFDAEIDAAKAYNVAALAHFGEFALVNQL